MHKITLLSVLLMASGCMDPGGAGNGSADAGQAATDAGAGHDAGTTPRTDAGVPATTTSITEIQQGTVEVGSVVLVAEATVTAVAPGTGFWIQQGEGPFTGIFVFGSLASETDGLAVGKTVTLSGTTAVFEGLTQLTYPTVTEVKDGTPAVAAVVAAADLSGTDSWEGVLVAVESTTIVTANPDGPDNDYGQILLNDDLLLDDMLYTSLDSGTQFAREAGVAFDSITGVMHHSFGSHKLLPRNAGDVVVVGGNQGGPAVTVREIQMGDVAADSSVRIEEAVVTAVTPASEERSRGFWIQQGAGPYSGVFVYAGRDPLSVNARVGAVVNVNAVYVEYGSGSNLSELINPVVELVSDGGQVEVTTVAASELAGTSDGDNHDVAEQWEGVLVRIENVEVTNIYPDAEDGDACPDEPCRDYGELALTDGLRMDDYLVPDLEEGVLFERRVGLRFLSVTGIADERFGNHKIVPRRPEDVVVAPNQ
jgi:predicted extracellular nuclease